MKNDIAATITESIIKQLETGTAPWIKPWSSSPDTSAPHNPATGTHYRGINFLWLSLIQTSGEFGTASTWMTYKQAEKIGAQVSNRAKGKGVQVVFYKPFEITGALNPDTGAHDKKVIPMLKTYTVFNTDFIDGLPVNEIEPVEKPEFQSIEDCENLLQPLALTFATAVTELFSHLVLITFNCQKKRIFALMRITTPRHCMNCHIGLAQNHA
jgi:antirestriction protein ArdC